MINAPIKGAIGYIIALLTSVATPPFDTLNVRELPTLSAAFAAPANLRLALFTILNPLVPVFVMITKERAIVNSWFGIDTTTLAVISDI